MDSMERFIRIRITCADPEAVFSKLAENGVDLLNLINTDSLTKELTIYRRHFHIVKSILERYGGSYNIVRHKGFFVSAMYLLHRPVLLCGSILFLLLLLFTSERIFFIRVTGNQKISTEAILSQAQMYGLEFGTKAADVRSEEIKNAVLRDFPQLQWLGITTSGSVATIHVTERSTPKEKQNGDMAVLGIHATRDGVISQMIVERGTPLFQVGQRVKAGDLLVSGYTDCGIKIRAEQPIAEIFAYTLRDLSIYSPKSIILRGEVTGKHRCYKVRIGKKVINLCNHSGIQDTTCVKMYEEDYVTLPGGFQLPISVIKISCQQYDIVSSEISDDVYLWLQQYARMYLQTQMIAGEILSEDLAWNINDQIHILVGSYACQEMIGQVKNEETFDHHAEDN